MRSGWWTGPEKTSYGTCLRDEMAAGTLRMVKDFVNENPFIHDPEERRTRTLRLLKQQMTRCRSFTKITNDPFAKNTTTFSGKIGQGGKLDNSIQDDIVLALGMNLYLSKHFHGRTERMLNSSIDYRRIYA